MARGPRRDRKKEEFWRQRLGAQAGSGLSVRAWCRRHGVRESAFYWWRTRLARRKAAAPPSFAPVHVVADTAVVAAGRIEIMLPGERRVHVVGPVERRALAEVLAALADSVPAAETPGC
jgi:transposase-like protein